MGERPKAAGRLICRLLLRRCSLNTAVMARRVSRVLAPVSDECSTMDCEGIGLGFTNTPVTNTATAAVPRERAGMASGMGMGMGARFISLAVNIAVMGLILRSGVHAHLTEAVTGAPAADVLAGLAGACFREKGDMLPAVGKSLNERIAAGIICAHILFLLVVDDDGRARTIKPPKMAAYNGKWTLADDNGWGDGGGGQPENELSQRKVAQVTDDGAKA